MRETKSYNEIDYYQYYLESITSNLYYVDKVIYKQIIFEFFKEIKDRFLENAKTVKLPCRVGRLQIIKKRPKSWLTSPKSIDYKLSKELGILVYHLNDHSNGYKYRLYWDKQDSNIKNKTRYQMVMMRDTKRRLAYLIKNKIQDYIEIN